MIVDNMPEISIVNILSRLTVALKWCVLSNSYSYNYYLYIYLNCFKKERGDRVTLLFIGGFSI